MIIVFAAIVTIVNPFRELLTHDDGWAYARSVKHLLDTGEYRLDSWAAANMPVQIYLAAGSIEGIRVLAEPAANFHRPDVAVRRDCFL